MGSDMRMIVGVSGATGVEMSYYLVRALKDMGNCEIHLILSEGAKVTWDLESSVPLEELTALADFIYDEKYFYPYFYRNILWWVKETAFCRRKITRIQVVTMSVKCGFWRKNTFFRKK